MTADELKSAGRELFGHGWQTRLAEQLGVDGSTVRRWVSGAVPVPNPAAAAIRAFLQIRQLTGDQFLDSGRRRRTGQGG